MQVHRLHGRDGVEADVHVPDAICRGRGYAWGLDSAGEGRGVERGGGHALLDDFGSLVEREE